MKRTITLSLLMLVSVVVMLPFANSAAHGLGRGYAARQRHYRHHSRAWWRRYRARLRTRRAAAAMAMAHRDSPLGPAVLTPADPEVNSSGLPKLPAGWNSATAANNGELRFRTEAKAPIPSQGTLAVVARSRPNPAYLTQREQRTMLSGVSFSDLRRIAIDKMIATNGWVINDYERQINGARVFIVIGQTPADGRTPERAWNFYFAEVDGKIYSLTLSTPLEFSNQLTAEGEKFISSIGVKANSTTQPANK
ncbi:MAG TPA: hypothetical protein VLL54_09110 [Pyrinomonadaceae bacterium]|nr:hypothetical protein [Pyrinomonadaceae bacterium]